MIPNLYLWAGVSVLILGLSTAVYIEHERLSAVATKLSATEAARDQWKQNFTAASDAAQVNAAALVTWKAMAADGEAKAEAARQDAAKLAADYDALKRKIHDAPQTDDAPVAPVLRAAVDGLRR